MNSPPDPTSLQNPLPDGTGILSNPGLDPGLDEKARMSKRDMCRSGFGVQRSVLSELTGKKKGTRDAGVILHTPSSRGQEELTSPLRLALARRSVKKQIFTYMDQGDKKTDIESRTGLSHQCIKWHRWLWRNEGSHPRSRSKKASKNSSRGARSPNTRSERSSRKRPACDGTADSSVATEYSSEKKRRKHCAVKQSKGRSIRAKMEVPEYDSGRCAEKETKGSACFADKENIPGRDEATLVPGGLKVLPVRHLRPQTE